MKIIDRLQTNPELIDANVFVGEILEDLIASEFGEAQMVFTAQNGKITYWKGGVIRTQKPKPKDPQV